MDLPETREAPWLVPGRPADHQITTTPTAYRIELRPYQLEALEAVEKALARGVRRQAIQLPTGSGKTIVFAELLRRRGGRALVFAHRDELIGQAAEKIRAAWPQAEVGVVKAERDEVGAPVVVASVQTLARRARLERLPRDFGTVVVDEAHHAAAPTYGAVLEYVRAWEDDGPLVLGVSATLRRGDGVRLDDVFEEVVYSRSLLDLIRGDYLCDAKAKRIAIGADFAALRVSHGDFIEAQAEEMMLAADAPAQIAAAYREHARERTGIVFTSGVALAHATAAALVEAGIAAEALDGSTPLDERRAILRRLRSGETRAVANCAVLTEGFDEPRVDCIVVARPTRSRGLYVQMVGRGFRKYPRKADLLVLDVCGVTARHDLLSLPTLFGVEPREIRQRTVTEALAERERVQQAARASGPLVAREVGLFARRRFAWVAAGADRFALPVTDGQLVIARHGEEYVVAFHSRMGGRELVARAPSLELACGLGEDRARRLGSGHLADRGARWRGEPATPKQLDTLRRMGGRVSAQVSRGEASDLITSRIARYA